MDKDKYGIELDLIINRFKDKMNQIQDMLSTVKSKYTFEIDPNLNTKQLQLELAKAYAMMRKISEKDIIDEEDVQRIEICKDAIDKIVDRIKELGGKPIIPKLKETKNDIKDVEENIDDINSKSKSGGLKGMFTSATKSLKRFALSLFGIQSIWRILSKASRSYMEQNSQLANKMQAVWNSLGELLSPIINMLVNLFMKLLGYINVVTKALFNFDFIAKANANTLKNYQKQANKTSKALAGIDELTNINQQTDNQNDTGPALLEVPELDPKIVKFLQDMAQALKDNWDWISKVLIALGAVFGVSAVAGWVSNIAGLIGGSGIGLLGLAGALIWIYDIIKLQELKKEWDELQEYNKELDKTLDKLHEKYKINLKDRKEEAKTYKKGSQEMAQYVGMLKSNIEMNLADMESHDRKSKAYKRAEEEMKQNIKAYTELYKSGQLTDNQARVFTETLYKLGYNLNGSKMKTEEYRFVLKDLGFSEKDINDILSDNINKEHLQKEAIKQTTTATKDMTNQNKEAKTTTNNLGDALKNIASRTYKVVVDSKSTTNEAETNVDDMVKKFTNALKKPFQILFKSKVEKPDVSEVQNIINGVFGKLGVKADNGWVSAFGVKLFKIPGFAIGTDLVKSDGLAYIHKGEQIVPADAVKGGYTGGNNEKTNELLRELIYAVESKDFNATISSDDVGRASVNYIRNQNRIMGGSVI